MTIRPFSKIYEAAKRINVQLKRLPNPSIKGIPYKVKLKHYIRIKMYLKRLLSPSIKRRRNNPNGLNMQL